MTGPEPGQAEVLAWMRRTGGSATDALHHFWPGIAGEPAKRTMARIRKWAERARRKGAPDAPALSGPGGYAPPPSPQGPQHQLPSVIQRPAPRVDLAQMSQIERIEWQLAEVGADLELARAQGDLRAAVQLDKRLSELGADLDAARSAASRMVKLDRTPGAIAAELAKRAKAIQLRAEMRRRAEERAAERAARERDL